MNQLDLFGNSVGVQETAQQKYKRERALTHNADGSWKVNLMLKLGDTPGKKCKTCKFLTYKQYANRYYKCLKRECGGPATDHRVNWPACSLYQEQVKIK